MNLANNSCTSTPASMKSIVAPLIYKLNMLKS